MLSLNSIHQNPINEKESFASGKILSGSRQDFKVLIANDEMMQLEVLTYKFESTDKCSVDKALNGFEAF